VGCVPRGAATNPPAGSTTLSVQFSFICIEQETRINVPQNSPDMRAFEPIFIGFIRNASFDVKSFGSNHPPTVSDVEEN